MLQFFFSLLSWCCPVLTVGVHFGLNCGPMEYLEGEQHYQYPVERNPRTYMSMRDYRNTPWVSAPSYMVPPQYAPPLHPKSTSPMEEAILNLTKLVGNFVEVQKTINAQLSQNLGIFELPHLLFSFFLFYFSLFYFMLIFLIFLLRFSLIFS